MKEFTKNEALEMMYNNTSNSFRKVANWVKESDMNKSEIIDYLIEIADEHEAQSMVVKLRDDLNKNKL